MDDKVFEILLAGAAGALLALGLATVSDKLDAWALRKALRQAPPRLAYDHAIRIVTMALIPYPEALAVALTALKGNAGKLEWGESGNTP